MKPSLLEVENLGISFVTQEKTFRVVSQISFELQEGETLGLVGESGSGKTITALSLVGLLPSPPARMDSGVIRFLGNNVESFTKHQWNNIRGSEIGFIFQEPRTSLNPVLSVGSQISETISAHQALLQKEAKAIALESMKRVGISQAQERYNQYPHQLSGGMCQRIMIAMVLACRPRLILADEPTSALDVTVAAQILDLLSRLQEETKMGMILISHDLAVVADMAHRVAILHDGSIVEMADTTTLFSAPLHPYTQTLLELEWNSSNPNWLPNHSKPKDKTQLCLNNIKGCSYASQCRRAKSICFETAPKPKEITTSHIIRCHNP